MFTLRVQINQVPERLVTAFVAGQNAHRAGHWILFHNIPQTRKLDKHVGSLNKPSQAPFTVHAVGFIRVASDVFSYSTKHTNHLVYKSSLAILKPPRGLDLRQSRLLSFRELEMRPARLLGFRAVKGPPIDPARSCYHSLNSGSDINKAINK